jgi:23S rRNA pseudouridine1911/1915/1917 synthase
MINPLQVLYEDNHLLIINKPAGMLVQGDVTGDKPLVDLGKEYIKIKYQKPGEVFLGVVHRLDQARKRSSCFCPDLKSAGAGECAFSRTRNSKNVLGDC